MPYFAVDDQITFHPKAVAAGNAAMGAWTRAGAWAKNHATGGFVSADVAHAIGAKESKRLVAVGLWEPGDHPDFGAGYWFHDWEHIAGNFDGAEEKARRDAKREADRERQRQKRDRDRERDTSHAVTRQRLSSPPSPVPSPLTDVTNLPASSPEIPAVAEGFDAALVSIVSEKQTAALAAAKRSGIKDLWALHGLLETAVGEVMTPRGAVELVDALLTRSKHPVIDVDAYVATACRDKPASVKEAFDQFDIGAVA